MRNKQFDDYDINLLYQDYLGNADQIKYKSRYAGIYVYKEKLGCHGARVTLLRQLEGKGYEVYVNLDDDMELIPQTNYVRAIEKALCKDVGFVLTNWARTEALAQQKIPKMSDIFAKQIMIYQGGGMVYSEKIAKLMRGLPVCHSEFDDIWPLTSYINGYDNYKDFSSIAIHHVCGKGGMRSYMKEQKRPLLCKDYIDYKYGRNGTEVLIPLDKDVNEKARLLHRENRERILKGDK